MFLNYNMAYTSTKVTFHNVMVDATTDRSHKVRILGNYSIHDGRELTFYVPKSQSWNAPQMYQVGNMEVSQWFWNKIKNSIIQDGYNTGFVHAIGTAPAPTISTNVPPLKQYKMLSLATPADAHDFVKFIANYFKDPMDLERYLDNQLQIANGVISVNLTINVKDLLNISVEEFKSELIQSALMHFFKDNT